MAKSSPPIAVHIMNAFLDDLNDEIILRGVIDPASLPLLKVDLYQREARSGSSLQKMVAALKEGASFPSLDLGMRGGHYSEQSETPGSFYLHDDIFIIDGLQRQTAALRAIHDGFIPNIGVTIHFNTNRPWEKARFRVLNISSIKLAANVMLRNLAEENAAINLLVQMCHDSSFALCRRVCWQQTMKRGELLNALTFLKISAMLHSRFATVAPKGTANSGDTDMTGAFEQVAGKFERTMNRCSRKVVQDNIKTYWEVIDEVWGVRNIAYKELAVHLRGSFLLALARVFADHTNFWNDNRLVVEKELRKKLALFKIQDPSIANLAGASGKAKDTLYRLLVDHINSGKRTKRLDTFVKVRTLQPVKDEEAEESFETTAVEASA